MHIFVVKLAKCTCVLSRKNVYIIYIYIIYINYIYNYIYAIIYLCKLYYREKIPR